MKLRLSSQHPRSGNTTATSQRGVGRVVYLLLGFVLGYGGGELLLRAMGVVPWW